MYFPINTTITFTKLNYYKIKITNLQAKKQILRLNRNFHVKNENKPQIFTSKQNYDV